MEAGLDRAQELFGKFLWDSQELHNVWKELPLHPLQVGIFFSRCKVDGTRYRYSVKKRARIARSS